MKRRQVWLAAVCLFAAPLAYSFVGAQQPTIKVGILHSLSGTMAISETTLKDTVLMMIEEQNKKGGLHGRKLEAVVVDPASNWPLPAREAAAARREGQGRRRVLAAGRPSRASRCVVFEKDNGLLFYRCNEGEESSKNVIYTGAAPNQQAIPAVDYLMKDLAVKRWCSVRHRLRLSAHDQPDPRGLPAGGRRAGRHLDQLHAVRPLRLAGRRGGDQEVRRGRQEDGRGLDDQRRRQRAFGESATRRSRPRGHPVAEPSRSARGGARLDAKPLVGTGVAGTTSEHPGAANKAFIAKWQAYIKNPSSEHQRSDGGALHHRLQPVGDRR
jgi:urea transport system substrate-binding protein